MITLLLAAQVAACVPTSLTHERWVMKTRPAPESVAPTPLTVTNMLAWAVPFITNWKLHQNATLAPQEGLVFELTAYLRLVKQSGDDCDVHMQLSEGLNDVSQVIAEIPMIQPTAREALEAVVGPITGVRRFSGSTAPRLKLVGWGFLDLSHQSQKSPTIGHAHGTTDVKSLWELHPVWSVVRVQ